MLKEELSTSPHAQQLLTRALGRSYLDLYVFVVVFQSAYQVCFYHLIIAFLAILFPSSHLLEAATAVGEG
jgi:hypothetical protein